MRIYKLIEEDSIKTAFEGTEWGLKFIDGLLFKTNDESLIELAIDLYKCQDLQIGAWIPDADNFSALTSAYAAGCDFFYSSDAEVSQHDLTAARKLRILQSQMISPPKYFGGVAFTPGWNMLEIYDRARALVNFPTFSQSDANLFSEFCKNRQKQGFPFPMVSNSCVFISELNSNVDFLSFTKNVILDIRDNDKMVDMTQIIKLHR